MSKKKKIPKKRNPIAQEVRKIRPQRIPDKTKYNRKKEKNCRY